MANNPIALMTIVMLGLVVLASLLTGNTGRYI